MVGEFVSVPACRSGVIMILSKLDKCSENAMNFNLKF